MKTNFNNWIIPLSVAISAISCTSDSTSDLTVLKPIGIVSYAADIKPIIDQNCISCHADVPINGAPMALTTYAHVRESILTRPLIDKISRANGAAGLMPNGGPRLPQEKIDLIIKWRDQGFQP